MRACVRACVCVCERERDRQRERERETETETESAPLSGYVLCVWCGVACDGCASASVCLYV